jgi:dihydroorotate dehydrogenase
MWYPIIRRALFALEPEAAHQVTLQALRSSGVLCAFGAPRVNPASGKGSAASQAVSLMGLRFANAVGMAAGFDKDAVAVRGLLRLGFGFVEVGTVTPRPQPGQNRPRIFRLETAEALINRLGFPSEGADAVRARLAGQHFPGIVGVNIGKNGDTPNDRAIDDYLAAFRKLADVADYVAVNVSSPNTKGLRALQSRDQLEPILSALMDERSKLTPAGRPLPILVKISPDLQTAEIEDLAKLLLSLPVDGVIATNTTITRMGIAHRSVAEAGGLSGAPLFELARTVVAQLRNLLGPAFPIIAVGGINSPERALAMRAAGANLVQMYTGLVYRGPALVTQCARALSSAPSV